MKPPFPAHEEEEEEEEEEIFFFPTWVIQGAFLPWSVRSECTLGWVEEAPRCPWMVPEVRAGFAGESHPRAVPGARNTSHSVPGARDLKIFQSFSTEEG